MATTMFGTMVANRFFNRPLMDNVFRNVAGVGIAGFTAAYGIPYLIGLAEAWGSRRWEEPLLGSLWEDKNRRRNT
jgi:hypothetical protein